MDPNKEITLSLGSPLYMAPEIVARTNYNSKVDIWSLGVIAWMLLTSKPPFDGKTREEMFENIKSAPLHFKGFS